MRSSRWEVIEVRLQYNEGLRVVYDQFAAWGEGRR